MSITFVSLTEDGPLFGKNSDRGVNEPQSVRWHAAREHAFEVPGARAPRPHHRSHRHPHALVISQPLGMVSGEMGANDHDLVIGLEGSTGHGPELLRLALEGASGVDQAIEVIVTAFEANPFASPGVWKVSEPPTVEFLIVDRHGAARLRLRGKRWSSRRLGPGLHQLPGRARLTQATQVQTVSDAFALLRSHGASARPHRPNHLRWSRRSGAASGPCAHAGGVAATQTTGSWVADLTASGTLGAGARHWVTGTSTPCTAIFYPIHVGRPLLEEHPLADYDPDSWWWQHEALARPALVNLPAALALFGCQRDQVEQQWLAQDPDSAQAQLRAHDLGRYWQQLLRHHSLPETRPGWVVRRWAQWDKQARMQRAFR